MAARKILLQLNFIALGAVNLLLLVLPTCVLRVLLLRMFFDVSWRAAVHRGLRITSFIGPLSIGADTVVGPHCLLDNRRGLYIGANATLTSRVSIYTLGHDLQDPARRTVGNAVHIADDAYLFTGCAVMPGASLGRASALAPFSVLTKRTGDHEFWAGNPAVKRGNTSDRGDTRNDYRYLLAL